MLLKGNHPFSSFSKSVFCFLYILKDLYNSESNKTIRLKILKIEPGEFEVENVFVNTNSNCSLTLNALFSKAFIATCAHCKIKCLQIEILHGFV